MSLLVMGASHRSAPVGLLETIAARTTDTAPFLRALLTSEHVSEAVVLSTCNRIEIYAAASTFHGALSDLGAHLANYSGVALAELANHLYVYYADDAVKHTMRVAAGLDSLVVGEPQILGQLRSAYAVSVAEQAAGTLIHEVIQHALRIGKKVHAETDIDHAGPSVVSAALSLGKDTLGDLAGRSALLVGAGAIGAVAVSALQRFGVSNITIINRSLERAQRLATKTGAEAKTWAELPNLLATVDIVICGTGSPEAVLTVADLAQRPPGTSPMLICDVAIPRDTEPAVAALPGITVIDMHELTRQLADKTDAPADIVAAQIIVERETTAFLARQQALNVAPTVTALRARAESIVAAELNVLSTKLPAFTASQYAEIERTVRRVVNTLLHTPSVRMKELAATADGYRYVDAVRELFSLDVAETKENSHVAAVMKAVS